MGDKAWRVHKAMSVRPGSEAAEEVSQDTGELVAPGGIVWRWEGAVWPSGEWDITGGSSHIQKGWKGGMRQSCRRRIRKTPPNRGLGPKMT